MAVRALVVGEPRNGDAVARMLGADGGIEAAGPCGFADLVEEVRSRQPDILVMVPSSQVEAVAAIERVMARAPVPILVLGADSWSSPAMVSAGAVEVLPDNEAAAAGASAVRERVRLLSTVNVIRHIRGRPRTSAEPRGIPIVAVGASTGGPQALVTLLRGLEGTAAAVLVVQHLNPGFAATFRDWIDGQVPLPVEMATAGVEISPGHVYLAPPYVHLKLADSRTLALDPEPPTLHRPSADVLFSSVAQHAATQSVGVLLTGMGDDGAAGLLEMRRAGARTIAQDEVSSVVYGMPQVANQLGAAEQVLPLQQIAAAVVRTLHAAV